MPGGSADRAGIKEDDVVISVNGEKINSLSDLQIAFMKQPSGIITKLGILSSDGTESEKIVYLENVRHLQDMNFLNVIRLKILFILCLE